ncbi:MAG: hypothetical protein ACFE7E_05830 [Candidatus Hodarchaeota archaeon]
MEEVSDQLFEILEGRNYKVAHATGIAAHWIATKHYTHSKENTSLVDLLIISKLTPSQRVLAMNQVADALDHHCATFMNEVKNEFDAIIASEGSGNSHTLQTLKRLIPGLETRKISLPMLRTTVYRIDENVVTFQVNPIILVGDESASSLDLGNCSREWLVASGNHGRYRMYIVPMKKLTGFLDAKTESAKETVEQLPKGRINRLTRPLSVSQKILTILGCVWALIALDIIFKTNMIPLNLYWSSLLIVSLAILIGAIASIIIGGIRFGGIHKDHFILPTEPHQLSYPSTISGIKTEYANSDRQFPLTLPKSSSAKNNYYLRDFKKSLKEAKSDFESRAFTSFFVKAQSALYSALQAKYFELTKQSPGILSFSQLVNKLRRNGLRIPSNRDIGKWTKMVELSLLDKNDTSFRIAKDYLLYLSRFITSLKPFEDRNISQKPIYGKMQEENRQKDSVSNVPAQS